MHNVDPTVGHKMSILVTRSSTPCGEVEQISLIELSVNIRKAVELISSIVILSYVQTNLTGVNLNDYVSWLQTRSNLA